MLQCIQNAVQHTYCNDPGFHIYSRLSGAEACADTDAQVAQLVEQRTENPRVGGSIPPLGTIFPQHIQYDIGDCLRAYSQPVRSR